VQSSISRTRTTAARDLAVGVFVLAGLLAIAYLTLQIGGVSLSSGDGVVMFATFDDIGGLSARSPVRIAGVKVGRVESIELDEDLRARVRLMVDAGLELSIDSAAAIRTSGLLGDQFIALEPGAEDELLGDGGVFSFTESAWNVDALVGAVVHGSGVEQDE
jgi:phospholipid/cholesterol/gamma-HCH transport system substrate-binding protein